MKLYACGYNLNGQISNSNPACAKISWTLIEELDGCIESNDYRKKLSVAFGFSYIVHWSGNGIKLRGFDSYMPREIMIPSLFNEEESHIIHVSSYNINLIIIQSNGNIWKLNLKDYQARDTESKSISTSKNKVIDKVEQVSFEPVEEIDSIGPFKFSGYDKEINLPMKKTIGTDIVLGENNKSIESLSEPTKNKILRDIKKSSNTSCQVKEDLLLNEIEENTHDVEAKLEKNTVEDIWKSKILEDQKPEEGFALLNQLFACELDFSDDDSQCLYDSKSNQKERVTSSFAHEDKMFDLSGLENKRRRLITQSAKRKMNQFRKVTCSDNIQLLLTEKGNLFNIPGRLDYFTGHVVVDIACGFDHCLALTEDGVVYSWGNGSRGQLGYQCASAGSGEPQEITALSGLGVAQITAGGWHSAARTHDGFLYTWGWNNSGQLGVRGQIDLVVSEPQPVSWPDCYQDIKVVDVACGSRHTIALCDNGSVWGCGWNEYNQLTVESEVSKVEVMTQLSLRDLPEGCEVLRVYGGHWNSAVVIS